MNVIESLVALARREDLSATLHFGGKPNHVALRLDDDGHVVGAEFCEGKPIRLPWATPRTSGPVPNLLFDNASYILEEGTRREFSRAYHDKLLERAPRHRGAKAIAAFFSRKAPKNKEIEKALDQKMPPDLVFYLGDAKRPICEDPKLFDAIAEVLKESFARVPVQSLFDDEGESLVSVYGKVRLPGLDNNQSLITCDKPVLGILPLPKSERMIHAPMSYATMRLHTGALEWLDANRRISTPDTSFAKLTYYGWTAERHRFEEVVQQVLYGKPKDTEYDAWRQWLQEHLDDDTELLTDETPYYLLEVACSSRIAIRDFRTLTVASVARNLIQFLDEVSFARGRERIRFCATPYTLLKQATPGSKFQTRLVEQMFAAVFCGEPYPRDLLTAASRNYEELVTGDEPAHLASATLNAIATRRGLMNNIVQDNPYFLCGRLFAVLERRNIRARDKGDHASIPRRLPRVSENPAREFPVLLDLSEKHAEKLERRRMNAFRNDARDLLLKITATNGVFPGRSTPEEKLLVYQGREYEWSLRHNTQAQEETSAQQEAATPAEAPVGGI